MDARNGCLSPSHRLSACIFTFTLLPPLRPRRLSISRPVPPRNYNGTGRSVHISSAAFKITSNNPKASQNWYLVAHAL